MPYVNNPSVPSLSSSVDPSVKSAIQYITNYLTKFNNTLGTSLGNYSSTGSTGTLVTSIPDGSIPESKLTINLNKRIDLIDTPDVGLVDSLFRLEVLQPTVFIQELEPTAIAISDIWVHPVSLISKRWSGAEWLAISPQPNIELISVDPPMSPAQGDIWIKIVNEDLKQYTWYTWLTDQWQQYDPASALYINSIATNANTTNIAAVTAINNVSATSDSANARALYTTKSAVEHPTTGLTSKASITDLSTANSTLATAVASSIVQTSTTLNGQTSTIEAMAESVDGVKAQYTVKLNANDKVAGFGLMLDEGEPSVFEVVADKFAIVNGDGVTSSQPFIVQDNNVYVTNLNVYNAGVIGTPTNYAPKGVITGNSTGDVFINTEAGVNWSKLWHERNEQLLNTKSSLGTYYPIILSQYIAAPAYTSTDFNILIPYGFSGDYILCMGPTSVGVSGDYRLYCLDRYDGTIKGSSQIPWSGVPTNEVAIYAADSDAAYRSSASTSTVLIGGYDGRLAYYQATGGTTSIPPTFTNLTALNLTGYHIQVIRTNGKRWLICARATDSSGLTKVMVTNADYASPLVLANWTTISYENFAAGAQPGWNNTFIAADIYDDRLIIISINNVQISAKWSYLSSINWNTIQFYDRDNNKLIMNNFLGGGSMADYAACHNHYRYNAPGCIFMPVYKLHTTNPFVGYITAARYYRIDPNIGGAPFGKLFFDSYEDSYGACIGYVASGITTVETTPFTDSSITAAIMTLPTDANARNSIMFITKGTKQTTGFYNTILQTGVATGYGSGTSRNQSAYGRVGAFTRGQASDNNGTINNGYKLPTQSIFWGGNGCIYVSQPANLLVPNGA